MPRAATSELNKIADVAFLNASVAFDRDDCDFLLWISKMGARPSMFLNSSAASPAARAVEKKTITLEASGWVSWSSRKT
jgi:hypothetical protein